MADKFMIIIFDGIGDRPVKELDDKTPLEAAKTPNLDKAAKKGINGLMDTIAPGIIPGSDTGHLAILGYDPYEVYTGRGPFEAAGIDLDLKPGEVAFRCNFSTMEDGKITDRRAGRIKEGTDELAETINDIDLDVDFIFKEAVEHRGVLVLKDPGLGPSVSDVDAHECGIPPHKAEALENTEENKRTAEILNDFTERSHRVLKDHPVNKKRIEEGLPPANVVLPRGAGAVPHITPIQEKHDLHGAAIAGIPLVRGVCKLAGMTPIDVDGATGGLDTDVRAIFSNALEALRSHDFVLVNIKGPDLLGHDGKAVEKKEFMEKIDKELDELIQLDDVYCVFTGDHSTPVSVKDHSGDPLPITICGREVRTDDVEEYGERPCAKGDLGRIKGTDLLNILLDLAKRGTKFGA